MRDARGASHTSAVILEINTRVGGDLAKHVPRPRAAAFFEALDALGGARAGHVLGEVSADAHVDLEDRS